MDNQLTPEAQGESPASCTIFMILNDFEERKNIFPGLRFFYRYAASGGHNAILHLLLLQPGIDINTPDQYVDLKTPLTSM